MLQFTRTGGGGGEPRCFILSNLFPCLIIIKIENAPDTNPTNIKMASINCQERKKPYYVHYHFHTCRMFLLQPIFLIIALLKNNWEESERNSQIIYFFLSSTPLHKQHTGKQSLSHPHSTTSR